MSLKDIAFLANIPSAYKSQKLYSILPVAGSGDLIYTGNFTTYRHNSMGVLEKTTIKIPPLDYDVVDGAVNGFPSMHNSKARTNFVKYSKDFTSLWTENNALLSSGVTDSINVTGDFGVNKFLETTANGEHYIEQILSGLTSGRTYAFSMYVKPVQRFCLKVTFSNSTDTTCQFILDQLTIPKVDADLQANVGRIKKLPNGWFRVTCNFTATATSSTLRFRIQKRQSNSIVDSYTGESGHGFFIWGAQVEANTNGSATEPSPFIETTNSIATRPAGIVRTHETNLTMPTGYPISVYWEGKIDRYASQQHAWSIYDVNSDNYYLTLDFNSDTDIRIRRKGTTEYIGTASYRTTKYDYLKIVVIFYNETDYCIFINGFKIESFVGSSVTYSMNRIRIGTGRSDAVDSGQRQSYKQFFMWKRPLTDEEAIIVTSYNSYENMAKSGNFKLA